MQFEQLGPYRLGKKLGQGGMGAVYAGVDSESSEPAAVKVLSPSLAAEEGFRARFEAEIESLKKLRHPNIVRLYGYGEQAGTLFYAMELVVGTSLEDELRAGRRFEWREVTQIAVKLCRALKHAHDHGVIHRDLKPANLLLTADGDIKLSDFGIARLFGNTRMTADGGVLGTAEYMAPEQTDGRTVTDRCDQYSLGGVLYALLAGRPPFRAKSLVEMLQLQRFADPEPITRYAPQTPAELARIVHQLLEKDPQKRFANTMILAKSLEAMERGLSMSQTRGDSIVAPPVGEPPTIIPNVVRGQATVVPKRGAITSMPGATVNPELKTTEATLAFDRIEEPREPAPGPAADTSTGRFTKVEDEREREAGQHESSGSLLSAQTLTLVAALMLLVFGGWYVMQPPSANKLFAQIEQVAEVGDPKALRASQPEMSLFLKHYADDPRADDVRQWQDEAQTTHPIQRAFTEAKRTAVINPELAATKFQALLDVFDDQHDTTEVVRHYSRLARVQLKNLQKQIDGSSDENRKLIQSRLKRAAELTAEDPRQAKRIYRGIIELYADKPWAAPLVAQARQALQSLGVKDTASP